MGKHQTGVCFVFSIQLAVSGLVFITPQTLLAFREKRTPITRLKNEDDPQQKYVKLGGDQNQDEVQPFQMESKGDPREPIEVPIRTSRELNQGQTQLRTQFWNALSSQLMASVPAILKDKKKEDYKKAMDPEVRKQVTDKSGFIDSFALEPYFQKWYESNPATKSEINAMYNHLEVELKNRFDLQLPDPNRPDVYVPGAMDHPSHEEQLYKNPLNTTDHWRVVAGVHLGNAFSEGISKNLRLADIALKIDAHSSEFSREMRLSQKDRTAFESLSNKARAIVDGFQFIVGKYMSAKTSEKSVVDHLALTAREKFESLLPFLEELEVPKIDVSSITGERHEGLKKKYKLLTHEVDFLLKHIVKQTQMLRSKTLRNLSHQDADRITHDLEKLQKMRAMSQINLFEGPDEESVPVESQTTKRTKAFQGRSVKSSGKTGGQSETKSPFTESGAAH